MHCLRTLLLISLHVHSMRRILAGLLGDCVIVTFTADDPETQILELTLA